MDDGELAGGMDPVDHRGDGANVAAERKNHAHVGAQAGRKAGFVPDGGDDGAILQGVIDMLFHRTSQAHAERMAPVSGAVWPCASLSA